MNLSAFCEWCGMFWGEVDVANVIHTERWAAITKENMHFYPKVIYSLFTLIVCFWLASVSRGQAWEPSNQCREGKEASWGVKGSEAQECLDGDLCLLQECLFYDHQVPLCLSCRLLIAVSDSWLSTWLWFLFPLLVFWTLTLFYSPVLWQHLALCLPFSCLKSVLYFRNSASPTDDNAKSL